MNAKKNRRGFFRTLAGQPGKTVTLLTADGILVEVDSSRIKNGKGKKATNPEIKQWSNQIKTKKTD